MIYFGNYVDQVLFFAYFLFSLRLKLLENRFAALIFRSGVPNQQHMKVFHVVHE